MSPIGLVGVRIFGVLAFYPVIAILTALKIIKIPYFYKPIKKKDIPMIIRIYLISCLLCIITAIVLKGSQQNIPIQFLMH